MPTAHTRYSWKYTELTDEAKLKAVETIAGKLGGDWWDNHDTNRVGDTIRWELGRTLKSPGWDTMGQEEFSLSGIQLNGWDVDRGSHVAVEGTLTRESAPGLPWADGVAEVQLTATRYGTTVDVEEGDVYFTCGTCGKDAVWEAVFHGPGLRHVIQVPGGNADDDVADADHTPILADGLPDRAGRCQDVKKAVKDALGVALSAGQKETEYIGSTEYATEWIENNDPDFTEDGELF